MRLKCIRLAGFKSFVDPTTVSFPSNMAAVVGPNGCGKSNIIDAVRWVMGESSAKNLRGEAMTDVIFNGSTSRKPVSQASIELVFDNSDATLLGEYASYAEISIRRRVSRDGQNTYFLNGSKCRRRDITDIFLGTGLGPRSYSIIEQGMISRLIEARPEDLRHFIEEAAGISKYKERRRETENRIRRTQENLARLTDLREELERQLERLQRQAQSAERYQHYKQDERRYRAQLSTLRWQGLNEQAGQRERVIAEQELSLEALVAEQCSADASIEQLRDGHHELSEAFNQVQGRFYSIGADIARVEQAIQHGQQRLRQLQDDWQEAQRNQQETESLLGHDQTLLAALQDELDRLEPELELSRAAEQEATELLEQVDARMQDWQQQWEQFNQASAGPRREAEVLQSRILHLEQSLERQAERERRLDEEYRQLQDSPESSEIQVLQESLELSEQQLAQWQEEEALQLERHQQLDDQVQQWADQHLHLQGERQRLEGRQASLEALQQAALDPGQGVNAWLTEQGVSAATLLAERLEVMPGWEQAVETVLASELQAIVLDDFEALDCSRLQQGELRLLSPSTQALPAMGSGSLLDKLSAGASWVPWLAQVRTVACLEDAWALRGELQAEQSLVSADGYWLGRNFLRVRRASDTEGGLLARKQALQALQQQLEVLQGQLDEFAQQLDQGREDLREAQVQRDRLRQDIQREERARADLQSRLSALQARHEQLLLRRQRLHSERLEVSEQKALEQEQLAECRLQLQDALDQMEHDTQRREQQLERREHYRMQVDQARQESRRHQEQAQQLAVRQGALKAHVDSTRQSLQRLQAQMSKVEERCQQLSLNLEEGEAPLEEQRLRLEEYLERRQQVEAQLREARQALEACDQSLREAERRRSSAEQQAQLLRGQLEQQRLGWQELSTRRQSIEEQLAAEGQDLQALCAELPEQASEAAWEQELEQLAARIQRLGPINLAAIDEYRQQSERKHYLDAQNEDLVEALATLENVIRKIDRETRNRFKATFEQINSGLQQLFPKVFGGGQAYLELTGEDLLDTGVAIMARPPGKKNSTIHLLSGGEKALTALALVFAIFQLNPAPFCMLDEVDAPLDDTNVGRYAQLVKEMSEKVQFIYITHNKIAMEMADQLMGVTMHEPGCSRLVAVDVEEAVALAEA